MKLTQIAILLSGAALSASALAADNRLGIPNIGDENDLSWQYAPKAKPFFSGNSTQAAPAAVVRVGDENDTSWQYAPKAKPFFSGRAAGSAAE